MATARHTYVDPEKEVRPVRGNNIVLGAQNETVKKHQDLFSIYTYALNRKPGEDVPPGQEDKGGIEDERGQKYSFPGNIAPEGYFYSPFYEVTLKELDDELQTVNTKRINFVPSGNNVTSVTSTVSTYNPQTGVFQDKNMTFITVESPTAYNFLEGQPFAIYDIMNEETHRGYLEGVNTTPEGLSILRIATEINIEPSDLRGTTTSGKSRYIISLLEDNAPLYAEFIPSTQKMIWRGPKKMSDLASDSPIYNMPFTNGRLYIHKNLNVFVKRQDPHGDYYLFRPSFKNPLRRFQIEGNPKLDFDYINYIIDSMVDAC